MRKEVKCNTEREKVINKQTKNKQTKETKKEGKKTYQTTREESKGRKEQRGTMKISNKK